MCESACVTRSDVGHSLQARSQGPPTCLKIGLKIGCADLPPGSEASLIDCAVFNHLSQFMCTSMAFPQQTHIQKKCPRLVEFMEEFKESNLLDWDEKQPLVDHHVKPFIRHP